MMINKNRFRVSNDKKVLHKIGKHWVTVSALTLALLGGTALAGSVTTHADTNTPQNNTTSEVKNQLNQTLANSNQAKSQNNTTSASGSASSKSVSANSSASQSNIKQSSVVEPNTNLKASSASTKFAGNLNTNTISRQANQLHSTLLGNQLNNTQPSATGRTLSNQSSTSASVANYQNNVGSAQSNTNNTNNSSVASNAPKNNISASSINSNSNASSVNADNSEVANANQISDMLLGANPSFETVDGAQVYKDGIVKGTWGTAPWNFNINSGLLSIGTDGATTNLNTNIWPHYLSDKNNYPKIHHITFNGTVYAPTNSSGLFDPNLQSQDATLSNNSYPYNELDNISDIDVSNLNTSNTTNMAMMFAWGHGYQDETGHLKQVKGLNKLDTSNVNNMYQLFAWQNKLHFLDFSNLDTRKAEGNNIFALLPGAQITHIKLGPDTLLIPQSGMAAGNPWFNEQTEQEYQGMPFENGQSNPGDWFNIAGSNNGTWNNNKSNRKNSAYWLQDKNGNLFLSNGWITKNVNDVNGINWNQVQHVYINNVHYLNGGTVDTNFGNDMATVINEDNNAKGNQLATNTIINSTPKTWSDYDVINADNNTVNSATNDINNDLTNFSDNDVHNASVEASVASSAYNNANIENLIASQGAKYNNEISSANNRIHNDSDLISSLTTDSTNASNAIASADGTIAKDVSSLSNDAKSINVLNGDNTSLSNAISSAQGTINGDSSAITAWKNSSSAINQSLASAIKNNGANSTAINNLKAQSATDNQGLQKAINQLDADVNNLQDNTAITFTFTVNGNQYHSPVTLTKSYIEDNAQPINGTHQGQDGTYNVNGILNVSAPEGYDVDGNYTVTIGKNDDGIAHISFNNANPAPRTGAMLFAMPHFLGGTQQNNNANDVKLIGHEAEFNGNITLNFGNGHSTTVHYDTGKNNRNVRTGDKNINLLNYAHTQANQPSDYLTKNLINGFDTTGFSFAKNGSGDYSITVHPSDAKNNGQNNQYSFTLNFTANSVTDHIHYMYKGHQEGSDTTNGTDDSSANWDSNDVHGLHAGWKLANSSNNFNIVKGITNISVTPIQRTDTINYVDQDGKNVGTQQFTGNDYQATDAGDNSIDVTKLNTNLDKGYSLNSTDNNFKYDGGTYTVHVTGASHTPASPITPSNKPSDANNNKSNKNMNKPTGDNSVLFTINVNDYNAAGTTVINHYTKYATETGKVGDSFTIDPTTYQTYGFNEGSNTGNKITGTIGDNSLSPSSATFNYYAKPYDPSKPVNPNDPTSPKPITVDYYGEKNGQANQLIASGQITGATGDTGNVENVVTVPKGYKADSNPNYTITTNEQTISINLTSLTPSQINGGNGYKPNTPSNKPSDKRPSNNDINNNIKHGFATITIVANDPQGKKVSYQTVDESNKNIGSDYTIDPSSFVPTNYKLDGDNALKGTINPDGSLSNGSATFTYDVDPSSIAPISVTFKNQNGDYVNKNTGETTSNPDDATITVSADTLATKGAVGDYVNITDQLHAPEGYDFADNTRASVENNGNKLNHILLTNPQVSLGNPLGMVRLSLTVPTPVKPAPQPKPQPKPNNQPNKPTNPVNPSNKPSSDSNSSNHNAAASAASASASSASASASNAAKSAAASAANSANASNSAASASASAASSAANSSASAQTSNDAASLAAQYKASSASASASTSASAASEEASIKASLEASEQANSSEPSDNGNQANPSNENNGKNEIAGHGNGNAAGNGIIDSGNANPTYRSAVEPSHLMNQNSGHLANLAQQAENIGSQPVSANHTVVGQSSNGTRQSGNKLPQTGEDKADVALFDAAAILSAMSLAGADIERKHLNA